MSDILQVVIIVIVGAGLLAVYFLPAIVAEGKQHPNLLPIALLNLFLGWTFVGWVAALVWATTAVRPKGKPPS